jgi:nitrite reductase (NADH) large subunit
MRHLILGNGAAGSTAAQSLRELNSADDITIVSSDNTSAYAKIMLPDYIGDMLEREKLFLRSFEYYKSNSINLILDSAAEKIDTKRKRVALSNGSIEEYDRLLIAIGAVSNIPPLKGLEGSGFLTINSIKDADVIKGKASQGGRALIIGAGLTGIEIGLALRRLRMEVCIVDKGERILSRQIDEFSSKLIEEEIKNRGISIIRGAMVEELQNRGNMQALLTNGQAIGYDLLIVAAGTKPNLELFRDTEIDYDRGIMVDDFMQTSVEDIFAAGDVCVCKSMVSNEYVSPYIWPNAMAQGKCAAYGMAGQPLKYTRATVAQSMVQLRELKFISMGMVNPKDDSYETILDHDRERRIYKKIILKDNVIKGLVLVNDISSANTLSGLLRRESNVFGFKDKLLTKDFKPGSNPGK